MQRESINTYTTVSSKTTTLIESNQKSSLIKQNQKGFIQNSNICKNSEDIKKSEQGKANLNNVNILQKDLNKNSFSRKKHERISRVPYNLKNNEILKLKFVNQSIKSDKFPKFSSEGKKNMDFSNTDVLSKRFKKNYIGNKQLPYISSEQKKFQQNFFLRIKTTI